MLNALTVDPSTPASLRTVITAFPGTVVLPPKAPVMVCVYVLPGAAPVTGPIVLNAPPLWKRKYHSTSQMSGTDRAVSAGRLPTAEPLARNKPTERAEVLQEVRGLEVVAIAKVPDGKMEAAAAKNSG